MKRNAVLALGLLAALALPAGAVAKPTKQDRRGAAKECKLLRGESAETREAFRTQYRNFGKCVSEKAREEAAERRAARRSAARDCRDEREADAEAFAEAYRNFGKCVSSKARPEMRAEDREDRREILEAKNAAKACAAEREGNEEAFADQYGTNHNDRNAFGKCVSSKSSESEEDEGSGS